MRLGLLGAAAALLAAPAYGQDDGDVIDGWTFKHTNVGCRASYTHRAEQPFELSYSRSYRRDREQVVRLQFDAPSSTVVLAPNEGGRPFELLVAGDARTIGQGTVARSRQPGAIRFSVTINPFGERLLAAGLGAKAKLHVVPRAAKPFDLPADRLSMPQDWLDACYELVGERLLNARPDPPLDIFPRGPVPKTNPATWVTPGDYPSRSLREMSEGVVVFTLFVSRYGFVERCRIDTSSGDQRLAARTCRLMDRRARFYPARDDSDEAVESTWSSAVRWMIPE